MDEKEERIARDDVLRYLCEQGGSARRCEVEAEVGDKELVSRAIKSLSSDGLLEERDDGLRLTEQGWSEGEKALRKHVELEKILGAHGVAHALEHLELSSWQIRKLASMGSLKPLAGVEEGKELVVAFPSTHNPRLLARLYGTGLVPGARLRLVAKKLGLVIVLVRGRLVALDAVTAEKILVAAD